MNLDEKPLVEALGQVLADAILTLAHLQNNTMLTSRIQAECTIVMKRLESVEQLLFGKPS